MLSKGVVAVLGPQSKANSDHIKSICDNTEVPYIETRPALTERHQLSSINLHPDPDKMGDILVALISRYQWSQVALLYDDNFALRSLQPLLDLTATSGGSFRMVAILFYPSVVDGPLTWSYRSRASFGDGSFWTWGY